MTKQQARILRHLETEGSLTRAEAMDKLGIANVTARISEMRAAGVPIVDTYVPCRNRFGDPSHYKIYTLRQEA